MAKDAKSRNQRDQQLRFLIERVSVGDRKAFAELYDLTAPVVFGVALKVLGERSWAEDVTQEAYLQIFNQAGNFQPSSGSVTGWVATIAHRRAVDAVRRAEARRRRERSQPVAPSVDETSEPVVLEDERRRVNAALGSLSDLQREAIELAYYQGLTYREVAERLDAPLGTIKTRMRDGLMRLRSILGAEHD
jgi:RNA polymerase sigma-70 factor (ECF subfamily)